MKDKDFSVMDRLQISQYLNWKIYIIFVLIIFSISTYARYNQYNHWKEHSALYFVDNYPAMTTLDAYIWLRHAKEYKNGTYYQSKKDKLRRYPEGTMKNNPVPLISYVIAKTSSLTGLSIYYSGLFLVPVLASLFIIPLSFYFYLAEMPMAGIVGSFVGTFSWMYYIRTSMGRVDTDLLQLFFLFLASLFMLLMYKSKRYAYIALNFIFMFVSLFLLIRWYGHAGIMSVYAFLAILLLFIKGIKDKNILIATSIVTLILLALGHNYIYGVIGFMHSYMFPSKTVDYFPNIINTITETTHMPLKESLKYILSSPTIAAIGLVLFAISAIFLKMRIIPILPILALGLVAFKSSNRTVMFLAPFAGIGIGFLIDMLIIYAKKSFNLNEYKTVAASFVATFLVVYGISLYSAIKFVPRPSIAPDIIQSFVDIKHKIKYANIFSWWDYGYAIEDIDGYATYHDGGVHGGARTYLIAKGFTDNNQQHLYNIISFVDKNVTDVIYTKIKNGKKPKEVVNEILNYKEPLKTKNDYLLFTRDMISKFGAISYFGNWNFTDNRSQMLGFQSLKCSNLKNNRLTCSGSVFDLNTGRVNNKIPIKRVLVIKNGHTAKNISYYNEGIIIELLIKNNTLAAMLICDDKIYNTNFNQMYILGNYDKNLFEEVYNNYPTARMFKIKSKN